MAVIYHLSPLRHVRYANPAIAFPDIELFEVSECGSDEDRGWYYNAKFPGRDHFDGDPVGPFPSSADAFSAASNFYCERIAA